MNPAEDHESVLCVVRGDPTPDEIAGVIAVLSARAAAAAAAAPSRRALWNDPARLVREPVHAHPGGWRASTMPR